MKKIMIVLLLASAGASYSQPIFSIGDIGCYKVHRAINALKNNDRYVIDSVAHDYSYLYINQTTIWNWVAGYLTAKSDNAQLKHLTNEEIVKKIDLICYENLEFSLKQASEKLFNDISQ